MQNIGDAAQPGDDDDGPTSYETFLRVGHVSAFAALVLAASASRFPERSLLPAHSILLIAFLMPVRFLLWSFQQPKQLTKTHYAIFLALGAATTFSSNALHVVASRNSPEIMLKLLAASALDICALWMRMAATVHRPSISAYPLLFMLVYGFSDLCIAAHLVHPQARLATYLIPALSVRAAVNATRLFAASRTILQVDQKKNEEKKKL